MARPTKFTPAVQERICEAIRLGTTYEMACQYGGIDDSTFRRWMGRNSAFRAAVKEAESAGLVGWLDKIERAADDGNWQAAAWKAERRYPQAYGRRVQEVVGAGGGPVIVREIVVEMPVADA